ncbi:MULTISPECIES: hypothetical protein [Halomonas]|uniref:hypothetical protein n=1 Tax=Halomonas TaxID=2745 RepID=UPI00186774F2|nr:hypothetical protein [Halomonas colorata]
MLSEEQYQIERLANENAALKDQVDEQNEKIRQLEEKLGKAQNSVGSREKAKKNNTQRLKKIPSGQQRDIDKKTYKDCQRCGVLLSQPKPGQKLCIRHQKIENEKAKKQRSWLGRYSNITVYQGGSPGGGKKR